jgi:stage II sporulation protein GA (sporulation sigma-E factor processing peptidase)
LVVYADAVFFLNTFIDFLLLWLTMGIRKQQTSMWRLVLAAVAGGTYSMLQLWSRFAEAYSLPVKILVSLLMIGVAYGFRHPVAFLRNLGVFYLVCFITGGAMIALHYVLTGDSQVAGGILFTESASGWGSPVSWIFILASFPLVWMYTKFSLKSLEESKRLQSYLTRLRICVDGKEWEVGGLVDTGNQLRDPFTRTPVILVELEPLRTWLPPVLLKMVEERDWESGWTSLPPEWVTRVRVIPFRPAGGEGKMMIAVKPDRVEILERERWNNVGKILIGLDVGRFSSDGTYQAIIHPSCFSETAGDQPNWVKEASS